MNKDLLSLLDANKVELEEMLKKYEYLNKTHNDLTKSMKENVDATNKFFKESGGVIEDIAVMRTSAKKDMIALNEAMSEQIALVKKVNEEMDEMSNKYHISKDELAEVIQLLEKRAEIQEKINNLGNPNLLTNDQVGEWVQLSDALIKVEDSIKKYGVSAERIKNNFDDGDNKITELVQNTNELESATKNVTTAQSQYNKSMQTAIDKSNNFKKSGWFSILSAGWDLIKNVAKKGTDKWLEVDQASRDFGRQMGLSAEQMEKHASGIYDNYGSMAKKLGMEFKEMYKFQIGYADATEKAVMLTHEQVGTLAGLSRTTGEQAINTASKNLDVFATSADATVEYMAKGSARASLEGLNVKKYSEAFANNIKMASRFTFKEGINGIQKMTLLSQRLKFNMESIGTAMDKFSTLEGALDAGAKLQVLGGSFAQNFGNPLEAMSEALLDGEAFTKRIIDTVASSAKFDAKTGEIDLSPLDKQRLKAAASAMGMNYEDLHNMATQSRKSQMIESAVGNKDLSEQQIAFLSNKAQYNKATGKWHLTDVNGEMMKKDISQMSAKEIDEARNADTYEKIISADVKGIHSLIQNKANDELPKLEVIKGFEESIAFSVAKLLDSLPGWVQMIIAAIAASQMMGSITDLAGDLLSRGGRKGFNALARKGGIGGKIGKTRAGRWTRKANITRKQWGRKLGLTKNVNAARSAGGKGAAFMSKTINGGSKVLGTAGKILGRAAVPLAIVGAGWEAYNAYSDYKSQKNEIMADRTMSMQDKAQALNDAKKARNAAYGSAGGGLAGGLAGAAAGAAIGSAIPIIGTAIGGLIGGIGGALLGSWGGSKIGEAVTEDVADTYKEISREAGEHALKSEEGYLEEKAEESAEGIEGGESVNAQVGHIEHSVENIDYKLGVFNSHMASFLAVNSEALRGNNNIVAQKKTNTEINVSDMRVNVGGQIKLVSDFASNSMDISKLLSSNEFKHGIIDIVNEAIKKQTGGRTKETSVA